jgi:RNA polymerase sigma-70 factor (ECF subfamily)
VYESDRALVARMAVGDQSAFDDFFRTSAPRLAAFVGRRSGLDGASVEDIVQSTLIKAMRNLSSYRAEASLFTWLTRICLHELADVTRKSARRPSHSSLDEPATLARLSHQLHASHFFEPEATLDAELHRAAVIRALNALPKHYALALEAKYGDGLSVVEIAELLGLTPTATQSVLARAREAFRQRWLEIDQQSTGGVEPQ